AAQKAAPSAARPEQRPRLHVRAALARPALERLAGRSVPARAALFTVMGPRILVKPAFASLSKRLQSVPARKPFAAEHAPAQLTHYSAADSAGLPLPTWGEGGGEGVTAAST